MSSAMSQTSDRSTPRLSVPGGVRPDRSGVPANSIYDRGEKAIRDLDRPSDLRFPTVIERLNAAAVAAVYAFVVAVRADHEAKTMQDLIAQAKAKPGFINFGSAGNGTTSHLAGELFRTMAGIDIVHVPYRGGALAAADVGIAMGTGTDVAIESALESAP